MKPGVAQELARFVPEFHRTRHATAAALALNHFANHASVLLLESNRFSHREAMADKPEVGGAMQYLQGRGDARMIARDVDDRPGHGDQSDRVVVAESFDQPRRCLENRFLMTQFDADEINDQNDHAPSVGRGIQRVRRNLTGRAARCFGGLGIGRADKIGKHHLAPLPTHFHQEIRRPKIPNRLSVLADDAGMHPDNRDAAAEGWLARRLGIAGVRGSE